MGPTIVCGVIIKRSSADGLIAVGPEVQLGEHRLFILESVGERCIGTAEDHKHIEGIETVEGAWFPTSFLRLVSPPDPSKIQVHARWHPALVGQDLDSLIGGTE